MPSAALAQPRPAATSPTAQATLLGQYGDWGAYTASPGGRKVCFALSKPTSQQDNPPNRRTAANAVYMFVSTRPDEKVNNEISLLVTGYAFKANTEATMTIGGGGFPMYTQNDGAWVKNAAEEARLIDTMRKSRRRGDQGADLQGHRDHRHVLAQGHFPGARPGGAGVPIASVPPGGWRRWPGVPI